VSLNPGWRVLSHESFLQGESEVCFESSDARDKPLQALRLPGMKNEGLHIPIFELGGDPKGRSEAQKALEESIFVREYLVRVGKP